MTILKASIPIPTIHPLSPHILPLTFPIYKNSFLYPEDGGCMFLRNTQLHVANESRLQLRIRLNCSSLWLPSNGLHCCCGLFEVTLQVITVTSGASRARLRAN